MNLFQSKSSKITSQKGMQWRLDLQALIDLNLPSNRLPLKRCPTQIPVKEAYAKLKKLKTQKFLSKPVQKIILMMKRLKTRNRTITSSYRSCQFCKVIPATKINEYSRTKIETLSLAQNKEHRREVKKFRTWAELSIYICRTVRKIKAQVMSQSKNCLLNF